MQCGIGPITAIPTAAAMFRGPERRRKRQYKAIKLCKFGKNTASQYCHIPAP